MYIVYVIKEKIKDGTTLIWARMIDRFSEMMEYNLKIKLTKMRSEK